MQHLDEGTIHSWLDGALSPAESASAEAHVAECPQCAAAVAEARGFIAASSRILTALDHAPRGVVPAAAPIKRGNRAIWRVAAAVVVVGAGTLVVFRSGGGNVRLSPGASDSVSNGTVASGKPSGVVSSQQATTSAPVPVAQKMPAAIGRGTAFSGEAVAGKSAASAPQRIIPESENKVETERGAQTFAPSALAGITALDAGTSGEQLPLKVVGTPRTLGAKVTLYEVASGDTVTLTEVSSVSLLESVVTTATGMTSRTMAATAPAASARRRDTSTVAAADSQLAAGTVGGRSPTPMAAAAAPQIENAKGIFNTITWRDTISGNMMKLSGRVPAVQLQQIRVRIERERAAAAAAAAKKKP
jgi:anti-sigma factor RsiW